MGVPCDNPKDPRTFEYFAKVNDDGVVVAMVALADGTPWSDDTGAVKWTDAEQQRYVYMTDLRKVSVDGLKLLPARKKPTPAPPVDPKIG